MHENELQYDSANQQQRGNTVQSYNVVPDEKYTQHRQGSLENCNNAPLNPNQTHENRNSEWRIHQQRNDRRQQSERRVDRPRYQNKGSGIDSNAAPVYTNNTYENHQYDERGYRQQRGDTKQYDIGPGGKGNMLTTNINRFSKNDPIIPYEIEHMSENNNPMSSFSSSYDQTRNKKKNKSNSNADETSSFSESEGIRKEKKIHHNTADDECSDIISSKRSKKCAKSKHSLGNVKRDKCRIIERKGHKAKCDRENVSSKRLKNKKVEYTIARRSSKNDAYLEYGKKDVEPLDSNCSSYSNMQDDTTCSSNFSETSESEKKIDLKRHAEGSLKPSIYHSMDIAIRKYKLARKEAQADKARSKLLTELKNEIRKTKQILRFTTEDTQQVAYSRHLVDLENELTKWNQSHSLDTCSTLTKRDDISASEDTHQRADIIKDEMSKNVHECTAKDVDVTKEKERSCDNDQNSSTTQSKEIVLDRCCRQTKVIEDRREYANIIAPIAMKENFTFTAKKDNTVFLAKVVSNPPDFDLSSKQTWILIIKKLSLIFVSHLVE